MEKKIYNIKQTLALPPQRYYFIVTSKHRINEEENNNKYKQKTYR